MMRWMAFLLLPFLMALDTPLADAKAETRAKALMEEIRCVACENEPISQSGADIAGDMRKRVRELVGQGASDAEVRDWFSARYGEFVLFRPSTSGTSGILLWGLPFGLLFLGAIGLFAARQKPANTSAVEPVAPSAFDYAELPKSDASRDVSPAPKSVFQSEPEGDNGLPHEDGTQK